MVTSILDLAIFACVFLIVSFALSQAWLAHKYSNQKKAPESGSRSRHWDGDWPTVLIQLPIYNERHVVERLLEAVAAFDYPANLLTIQLLDDSDDDTPKIIKHAISKIFASGGPRVEHLRRANREGYKAGALAYGLSQNTDEFVAIFDADFLPKPTFIKQILGYFSDSKIGMVQTRWEHLNQSYSALTRVLGFAIDNHFSVEQGGRQASDCFINFNGTAGMWRRKTIDEAGGWSSDCLTEDLDLSFRAQLIGWKFLFVEDMATPAELPTRVNSIRAQQSRWAKGAVETSRKNMFQLWASNSRFQQKLVGSFHMINSSIYLPTFLVGILSGIWPLIPGIQLGVRSAFLHISLLVSFVALGFTYWTSQSRGAFSSEEPKASQFLKQYLLFVALIIGFGIQSSRSVIEGLFGKSTAFVRTPKFNVVDGDTKTLSKSQYADSYFPIEFYLEIVAAIYYIAICIFCLRRGIYDLVDIYAFYGFGFGVIIYYSISERLNSWLRPRVEPYAVR